MTTSFDAVAAAAVEHCESKMMPDFVDSAFQNWNSWIVVAAVMMMMMMMTSNRHLQVEGTNSSGQLNQPTLRSCSGERMTTETRTREKKLVAAMKQAAKQSTVATGLLGPPVAEAVQQSQALLSEAPEEEQ